MKQITEIIIHPNFDKSAKTSIECMVGMVKENLGMFNILECKNNLNMPIVLFNGHLPTDVTEKVAKYIGEFGYSSTIITLTDDNFKIDGKQIEYED